jgi:REP element-mobilizing transposase RayT
MRYRRSHTQGGTFFFTVNLEDRSSTLLVDQVDTLRGAVRHVKDRHPFDIIAWVVLPDHLHTIWSLPTHDLDFSTRWMLIKGAFARRINRGNRSTRVVEKKVNGDSGNAGSGSIKFATTKIFSGTSITSTSIPLSTDTWCVHRIGRCHQFIGTFVRGSSHWIGRPHPAPLQSAGSGVIEVLKRFLVGVRELTPTYDPVV